MHNVFFPTILSAASKDEFLKNFKRFVTPEITDIPMFFEVFTDVEDENKALWKMWHIEEDSTHKAQDVLKTVLGPKAVEKIKKIVKR